MNSSINKRVIKFKEQLFQNPKKAQTISNWTQIDISKNPNLPSNNEKWDNTWDKGPWGNFHNYDFNNWGN